MTHAIETHGACSAYNNRAQVRQFLKKTDGAKQDLDRAILLAEARVPPDQLTLRQAHTQRGMLLKLDGLDDEARVEFEKAAKLGSTLAKKEAAKLNPIAKQCNELMFQIYNDFHAANK